MSSVPSKAIHIGRVHRKALLVGGHEIARHGMEATIHGISDGSRELQDTLQIGFYETLPHRATRAH